MSWRAPHPIRGEAAPSHHHSRHLTHHGVPSPPPLSHKHRHSPASPASPSAASGSGGEADGGHAHTSILTHDGLSGVEDLDSSPSDGSRPSRQCAGTKTPAFRVADRKRHYTTFTTIHPHLRPRFRSDRRSRNQESDDAQSGESTSTSLASYSYGDSSDEGGYDDDDDDDEDYSLPSSLTDSEANESGSSMSSCASSISSEDAYVARSSRSGKARHSATACSTRSSNTTAARSRHNRGEAAPRLSCVLIHRLPVELFLTICSFLGEAEYRRLLEVNRDLHCAITGADAVVWRHLCLHTWMYKQGFQNFVWRFRLLESASRMDELEVLSLQQRMLMAEHTTMDLSDASATCDVTTALSRRRLHEQWQALHSREAELEGSARRLEEELSDSSSNSGLSNSVSRVRGRRHSSDTSMRRNGIHDRRPHSTSSDATPREEQEEQARGTEDAPQDDSLCVGSEGVLGEQSTDQRGNGTQPQPESRHHRSKRRARRGNRRHARSRTRRRAASSSMQLHPSPREGSYPLLRSGEDADGREGGAGVKEVLTSGERIFISNKKRGRRQHRRRSRHPKPRKHTNKRKHHHHHSRRTRGRATSHHPNHYPKHRTNPKMSSSAKRRRRHHQQRHRQANADEGHSALMPTPTYAAIQNTTPVMGLQHLDPATTMRGDGCFGTAATEAASHPRARNVAAATTTPAVEVGRADQPSVPLYWWQMAPEARQVFLQRMAAREERRRRRCAAVAGAAVEEAAWWAALDRIDRQSQSEESSAFTEEDDEDGNGENLSATSSSVSPSTSMGDQSPPNTHPTRLPPPQPPQPQPLPVVTVDGPQQLRGRVAKGDAALETVLASLTRGRKVRFSAGVGGPEEEAVNGSPLPPPLPPQQQPVSGLLTASSIAELTKSMQSHEEPTETPQRGVVTPGRTHSEPSARRSHHSSTAVVWNSSASASERLAFRRRRRHQRRNSRRSLHHNNSSPSSGSPKKRWDGGSNRWDSFREREEMMLVTRSKSVLIHSLKRSSYAPRRGGGIGPGSPILPKLSIHPTQTISGAAGGGEGSPTSSTLLGASWSQPQVRTASTPTVPVLSARGLASANFSTATAAGASGGSVASPHLLARSLAATATTTTTTSSGGRSMPSSPAPISTSIIHGSAPATAAVRRVSSGPSFSEVVATEDEVVEGEAEEEEDDRLAPVSWKFVFYMARREARRTELTLQDLLEGVWAVTFRTTGRTHVATFLPNEVLQVGQASLRMGEDGEDDGGGASASPPPSAARDVAAGGMSGGSGAARRQRQMPPLRFQLIQGGRRLSVHDFVPLTVTRRSTLAPQSALTSGATPSSAITSTAMRGGSSAAEAAFHAEPMRTLSHVRQVLMRRNHTHEACGASASSHTSAKPCCLVEVLRSLEGPAPMAERLRATVTTEEEHLEQVEAAALCGPGGVGDVMDDWGWTLSNAFVKIFSVDVRSPLYVERLQRIAGIEVLGNLS